MNGSLPQPSAPPALPRWAQLLTRGLDDLVRIPGTNFGVGLDAVLGMFVPGVGDAVTGVGSVALLLLALRLKLPSVVLLRMVVNIAIDVIIGMLPFVGDFFDFAWKANRLNLELIEKHRHDPKAMPTAVDYILVGSGLFLALVAIAMPFLLWLVYGGLIVSLGSRLLGG